MLMIVEELHSISQEMSGLAKVVSRLTQTQAGFVADLLRTNIKLLAASNQSQCYEDAVKDADELLRLLEQRLVAEAADSTDGFTAVAAGQDTVDGTGRQDSVDAALSPAVFIDDLVLSPAEQRLLNSFAHIELTEKLSQLSVDKKKSSSRWKKHRSRTSDNGVFGVPLQTLLDLDRSRSQSDMTRQVPLVFEQLVQYVRDNGLTEEGILRVAGQKSRIQELKCRINQQNQFVINECEDCSYSVHDVASVLKQLLRELPTPLLSLKGERSRWSAINPIQQFLRINMLKNDNEKLELFNLLILMLPEVNRQTLKMLLGLLGDVIAMETTNRMNTAAVAAVMTPTLFLMAFDHTSDPERLCMENAAAAECITFMINNQQHLWKVPASLKRQLDAMKEPTQRPMTGDLEEVLRQHCE
jgi:hypothetical protein